MTAEYSLLIRPELQAQLHALRQHPRGRRELDALRTGLRALVEGREHEYDGERLGYSPSSFDLRDCAQLRLPVGSRTHLLIYREFDSRPVREAVCFEHYEPWIVAAQRLGRMAVRPDLGLLTFPPDLRDALNAAWHPAPASGAVTHPPQAQSAPTVRNHTQSTPGRQR